MDLPPAGPPRWALVLLAVGLLSCSAETPPDVVLVSIDTLRADRLGCYGHEGAHTPTLDRLARQGLRFEQCTAPTPITLPSHATMLTGRLPHQHGVRNNGTYRLPSTVPTLAEQMREQGYATGAVVAAFPLLSRFGLDRGFEHYDDAIEGVAGVRFHNPERSAPEVVRTATEWWERVGRDRPRFLFVHFYEPHHPYAPPPPFDRRFADDPYDGEVAAADAALGQLLERLGDDPKRIVMVTSDHGEGLGDHREASHGLALYESTQRVPWIVHAPGRVPAGAEISERVGLLDLAPTLLRLAGLSTDGLALAAEGDGRVLPLDGSEPAQKPYLAETLYPLEFSRWAPAFSLTRGAQKVILSSRERAFDLAEDPGEQRDLWPEPGPAWAEGLLTELRQRIEGLEATARADRRLGDEEREALAALGYAGAGAGRATPVTGDSLLALMERLPDVSERWGAFELLTEAAAALDRGDLEVTLDLTARVLAEDPAGRWALTLRAEALESEGELERAVDAYEAVDRLTPGWLAVKISLARLHRREGEPLDAAVRYREALALDPSDARIRVELAEALADADSVGAALRTLGAGLARPDLADRERARLHTAAASLHRREGTLEEGRQELDAALAADPLPATLLVAGRYALDEGRWDEAVESLRRAAARLPDSGEPWLELGEVSRRRGRFAEAVRHYGEALRRDDTLHLAHNNRAWLLATELDRAAEAIASARRAVELRPDLPDYRDTLVEVLLRAGRPEQARQVLREALARFPRDEDLRRREEGR